ncbi:hypothetical protein CDCA_CDCA06G1968 [Cyanidium caldarium]|uniref:Maleylacetoacetate isomerase n=1 Tax=Cyanidium caldarium TaxID=2771 RepID=A0AAV9IV40_CYACA|nr:hypothetical protein CDCA_CDCA06G1968 [Cyanidium caldarium]
MGDSVILYSYWRSSCAYRVRIALHWKGIEYEYRAVDLNAGADAGQFAGEYRALNPSTEVPTLCIDGQVLAQSVAICEYLEETHRGRGVSLFPTDAVARAQVRRAVELINSGIQPLQNARVVKRVRELAGAGAQAEWTKEWIRFGLQALETVVARSWQGGPYCFGTEVTMADVFLMPQAYSSERFGVSMTDYPTLNRIVQNLHKLPAFAAAHPDRQPDAPRPGA